MGDVWAHGRCSRHGLAAARMSARAAAVRARREFYSLSHALGTTATLRVRLCRHMASLQYETRMMLTLMYFVPRLGPCWALGLERIWSRRQCDR